MTGDHLAETRRVLQELDGKQFDPVGWSEIEAAAQQLESALENEEAVGIRASTTLLSQALFEAKVRGRFTRELRGRATAPVIAPTKRTSALPVVGLICGLPILAIGWLLGGGVVLAFAIVFEVFILVIAVAGSRLAHEPDGVDDGAEPPTAPPAPVAARLRRLDDLVEEIDLRSGDGLG
jgi:hypothetical protein